MKLLLMLLLVLTLGMHNINATETGISIGFTFGFFADRYVDNGEISSFMPVPGVALHSFGFFHDNTLGYFFHGL